MTSTVYVPGAPLPPDCREAAVVLNRGCICHSVDHELLRRALEGRDADGGLSYAKLIEKAPNLFFRYARLCRRSTSSIHGRPDCRHRTRRRAAGVA